MTEIAVFQSTIRGRQQLVYMGQPYVFEKSTGDRKVWRCNQWWNARKCRARAYTIGNFVRPIQKYHTHEEIVHRKMPGQRKMKNDIHAMTVVHEPVMMPPKNVDIIKIESSLDGF